MHEADAIPPRCDLFAPETWQPDPDVQLTDAEAVIGARGGARCVVIQRKPPESVQYNTPPRRVEDDIRGFSASARRRMRQLLSSIERDAHKNGGGLFLTLTYHTSEPTGKDVKNHLHAFVQRLRRKWKGSKWSLVWRLEYQKRGAPHIHMLIWGVRYERKEWFKRCWHEITGETSNDHAEMGAWVERMPEGSKLSSYVSKYMAKAGTAPEGWQGRIWGVRNRKHLPIGEFTHIIGVPYGVAIDLARETLDEWGVDYEFTPYSLTIWAEDPLKWIHERLPGYI